QAALSSRIRCLMVKVIYMDKYGAEREVDVLSCLTLMEGRSATRSPASMRIVVVLRLRHLPHLPRPRRVSDHFPADPHGNVHAGILRRRGAHLPPGLSDRRHAGHEGAQGARAVFPALNTGR